MTPKEEIRKKLKDIEFNTTYWVRDETRAILSLLDKLDDRAPEMRKWAKSELLRLGYATGGGIAMKNLLNEFPETPQTPKEPPDPNPLKLSLDQRIDRLTKNLDAETELRRDVEKELAAQKNTLQELMAANNGFHEGVSKRIDELEKRTQERMNKHTRLWEGLTKKVNQHVNESSLQYSDEWWEELLDGFVDITDQHGHYYPSRLLDDFINLLKEKLKEPKP